MSCTLKNERPSEKEYPGRGSTATSHFGTKCPEVQGACQRRNTPQELVNVQAVMDGDLDGFIFAYLKAASRNELQDV